MVIEQGDVVWVDLPSPRGSEPGYKRPAVVVQSNALNRSRLRTVVCVPLTTNIRWADAPANVLLPSEVTGLPQDSVAQGSQIITADQSWLGEKAGSLGGRELHLVLSAIDIVLGR